MLTAEGCADRRRALRDRLGDYDLLVISQPEHIYYLSGFLTRPTELASLGFHFLLIDRDGHTRLVVDNLAGDGARAAFADEIDEWNWYDSIHSAVEKYAAAAHALEASLDKYYPRRGKVLAERVHLPALAWQTLGPVEPIDVAAEFWAMRQIKYPDELECIRRAIRATEAGHATARERARAGQSEIELYAEVMGAIAQAAGEPIVMLCDFAAGLRTGDGGGPAGRYVMQSGDLLVLDLFPLIGGYRADITNTLCIGQPTQEQRDHLQALKDSMKAGEAMLRPGTTGGQVFEACRASLEKSGMGGLPHHAGHAIGLGHPEPPYFVPESQDVLQAGNVVTLEPGAYRLGWGGARIEHNYLITETGFERLSNHEIGL